MTATTEVNECLLLFIKTVPAAPDSVSGFCTEAQRGEGWNPHLGRGEALEAELVTTMLPTLLPNPLRLLLRHCS